MGLSFGTVSSILQAISTIYQNKNAILSIFGVKQPTMESIMEEMGEEIKQDLQKIYTALQQNTLIEEWSGISNTLNYAHSTLKTLNTELGTVQKDSSGNIWILAGADSQKVSLESWCMGWTDGDGTQHRSALTQISELCGTATIIDQGLVVSSLSGIFSSATPAGNSGSLGADAIGTWSAMILLAKENPEITNLSGGFKDETQYESLLRLMNYVYELLTMALYVHDTALLLLENAGLPTNGHNSLVNGIINNFGQWNTPDSPWSLFAAEFESLASGGINTQAGNNQAAYSVNMNRGDYAHVTNHIPYVETTYLPRGQYQSTSYPYIWAYCGDAVSLADGPYSNAFFGSLGFTLVNPEGSDNYGFNLYLAVQGNVVQIGENMEMSMQGIYPDSKFYTDPSKWSSQNNYTNSFSGVNTYEGSYVNTSQLSSSNNNYVQVITGFQLQMINNGSGAFNVALALQFGILDVSNPLSPVVTIPDKNFYAPDYTSANGIQEYFSINQSGNYSNAGKCIRPAILTNASICRVANGDNALNVQAAPSIYKADFLQPAKIKNFTPGISTAAAVHA